MYDARINDYKYGHYSTKVQSSPASRVVRKATNSEKRLCVAHDLPSDVPVLTI